MSENYFHAVLEAAKSVFDRIRELTSSIEDGAALVDETLCGNPPQLIINSHISKSERSEQTGFVNLLKGLFGMFRNPTAHEVKIKWDLMKMMLWI